MLNTSLGAFSLPFFLLAGALAAQPTTSSLSVGSAGLGCQGQGNAPLLTNGVPAAAQLDFTYDAVAQQLTVDVSNVSPVTQGVPNPVITTVSFNVPQDSVDGVTLVSQTGAGARAPQFTLEYADVAAGQGLSMACFGAFAVRLHNSGVNGGIANPAADTWAKPLGALVVGPVRFVLQLDGEAAQFFTAQTIARSFSVRAPYAAANAALQFQGGGASAMEGGFVCNGDFAASCEPNIWINAPARIGSTVALCISGATGCAGCIGVSFNPNPINIAGLQIPVGLPIALTVPFPFPPGVNWLAFPVPIPLQQSLVGTTIYTFQAITTTNPTARGLVEFTPRFDITFTNPIVP